jgi:hypothetical protein
MPKLLAYLPCEKVVVEEQSRNVSVLSILETVTVTLASGAPPPAPNASIGMAWAIFTLWQKDPGESGEVESKSVLVSPEGERLAETPVARLDFAAGTRQQVINRMASFPMWTPGTCQLKLLVKTARDADFRQLAHVLIALRHARA